MYICIYHNHIKNHNLFFMLTTDLNIAFNNVSKAIYIFIHIHIYTYLHIYIFTYLHIYNSIYTYLHIYNTFVLTYLRFFFNF